MTWRPGWRQWRLPLASYGLLVWVVVRNDWSVVGVGLGALLLVIVWRDLVRFRTQTPLAGVLLVPDPANDNPDDAAFGPPGARPVLTRVRWFLRSWLIVEVEAGVDRQTLHLFRAELTTADFAAVSRWAVQQFNRPQVAGRPADQ